MAQYQYPFWKPRPTLVGQSAVQTEPRLQRVDDPPLPAMAQQAIAAEETRLYHVRFRLHKAESVLNFLFGGLTWLIGLRMILEFLSADPAKFVVKVTYSLTTAFMLPFVGIAPGIPLGPFLIDVSGFVAILFYAMLTWLVTRAMWLIGYHAAASMPLPRPKPVKTSEFIIR